MFTLTSSADQPIIFSHGSRSSILATSRQRMGELADASEMDRAVERLVAAYDSAGLPPVLAPDDPDAVLARINHEIAPLTLPAELERFWRLVDPRTIRVAPHPAPIAPKFALQTWTMHRDEAPGMVPRMLFPACYESHQLLLVELDDGSGTGGACLEYAYGDTAFVLRFARLSSYVGLLASMIAEGEWVRHDDPAWVQFDPDDRWPARQAAALGAAPLPAWYAGGTQLDQDVRSWPERWLRADGLEPRDRHPRGATTTLAELLAEAAAGRPAQGTVRATVVALVGSGRGSRVMLDDGTATVDVWCPAKVSTYGPVVRTAFEFDLVVVAGGPGQAPDLADRLGTVHHVLGAGLDAAQQGAVELYAELVALPAAAEATGIRPVD
jgi:hypothetical protein